MAFKALITGTISTSMALVWLLVLCVSSVVAAEAEPLNVYLFWQEGCPYCSEAHAELKKLTQTRQLVRLKAIELGEDANAEVLYQGALEYFGHRQAAVPLVVIGESSFLGLFGDGHSASLYAAAIDDCSSKPCTDIVKRIGAGGTLPGVKSTVSESKPQPPADILPRVVSVPLFGEVQLANLSLPALTILLAAIDGFNPCAMWVLVFLIGLLVGLKDEKRMWILGAAFLGATAIMYFAVMTAWLNLVLFLGALMWFRIGIGLLALGAGFFFLREYWSKPDAVCEVTNPGRRQQIMDAFRATVENNQLILSVAGIMLLAVAVNFIELLCSAGIPAVYTQVLAMNNLPLAANYGYIALYISVFMLDDITIFATAMFALRVSGLTGTYARLSHLIGGVVLLVLGAVLLLRPELLTLS